MAEDPTLLTLAEASGFLRVDQKQLRNLAKRGKIPGALILPGGQTRFNRAVLIDWVMRETEALDRSAAAR